VESFVVAMNDLNRRYDYPPQVRAQVAEGDLAAYGRAAEFINDSGAQVVSLQHEFGIFGGIAGGHVLELMRALQPPIVTTLHTVLTAPTTSQRLVFEGVVERSERLVVMSHTGAELLQEIYDVPASRIDVIPHGTPLPSPHTEVKARLGFGARPVLFTFGLLSPDKGIEHVIDALPEIIRSVPDVLYVVLGATHPHVLLNQGERYRRALEARAERLGVSSHLQLLNRFATPEELNDLLAAADVYVTPYLNMEQITSGTLSYALGAGKPVISTPYSHARELLAEGRGVLVPPRDAAAIAAAAVDLFSSPTRRGELAARALEVSAGAVWPLVADRYRDAFEEARRGHAATPRTQRPKHASDHLVALPALDLRHVTRLTDDTGIFQHAVRSVPRQRDGYCLDDNARALLLTTHIDEGDPASAAAHTLAGRYLAFVHHAFVPESGRFRNFMRYDRRWTEEQGSEDCHGRALWALGHVVRHSADRAHRAIADELFVQGLPATLAFTSPRAWAFTLLGADEYLHAAPGHDVTTQVRAALGPRLLGIYQRTSSPDWPWFEDRATYDNARLSQAAILSGNGPEHEELRIAGLRSLDWLVTRQRADDGTFAPIGSEGFYPRGGPLAAFDQQPLEAWAMTSACLTAFRATRDVRWLVNARRAFDWFLGGNVLRLPLYDADTGGCRDGLHADRPNENQGAESTLSFQLALAEMRAITTESARAGLGIL
jgi:glycosyltransferase involved in cell wall biosynthesis